MFIYTGGISTILFSSLLPRLVSSDRCHLSNSPASINSDHKEFGLFYYFSLAHKATLKSYIYSNISYYSKPIYRGTINVATYSVKPISNMFSMPWFDTPFSIDVRLHPY